jgi:hypothetical protein
MEHLAGLSMPRKIEPAMAMENCRQGNSALR